MKPNDTSRALSSGSSEFKGSPSGKPGQQAPASGALAAAGGSPGQFRGSPGKGTKPGENNHNPAALASRGDSGSFRGGQSPAVGHHTPDHSVAQRGGSPMTSGNAPVVKGGDAEPQRRAGTASSSPNDAAVPRGTKRGKRRGKGGRSDPTRRPPPSTEHFVQGSRRAAPQPMRAPPPDDDESMEDPAEEASETPDQEAAEEQSEPGAGQGDESGENPAEEATESPADESAEDAGEGGQAQAQGGPGSPDDPHAKELFDLAVARVLQLIQQRASDLDTALKADPIKATVAFGANALHAIAQSADDAGKPIPFQVLIQVGIQVIKILGTIAQQKGYLQDADLETFLKESFQQSLAQYAQLDRKAGKLTPQMAQALQSKLGGAPGGAPPGGPPQAPQPPAGPGAMPAAAQGGM